jgi:undecaprenyl-diphosphatase
MLEQFDQRLFLILNSLNSPFWDKIMHAKVRVDLGAYIYTLWFTGAKYKRKFLVIIFYLCWLLLADQSSVHLFKMFSPPSTVPSRHWRLVHLVNGNGGLYGFVSSHAANSLTLPLQSDVHPEKMIQYQHYIWAWVSNSRIIWGSLSG